MSQQSTLFGFGFSSQNTPRNANQNRNRNRNQNQNRNNSSQTPQQNRNGNPEVTPEMRAKIEQKRQRALERRRQNQLSNNKNGHNGHNGHNGYNTHNGQNGHNGQNRSSLFQNRSSTLTPAVNRMRMAPNQGSNNRNNGHNGRSPLTNAINAAPQTQIPNTNPQRTSQRKRTRKQYKECDDSDNSPITQPRKKARQTIADSDEEFMPTMQDLNQSSEDYSPQNSPLKKARNPRKSSKHKPVTVPMIIRPVSDGDSDSDSDNDNDIDIDITDNDSKNHNTNTNSNDDDMDALDRIATFDIQSQNVKRNSQYKHATYSEYKKASKKRLRKQMSADGEGKSKKSSGASHRDVSQFEWFRNPRDHSGRAPSDPNYNPSQIRIPATWFNKTKNATAAQLQYWKLKKDRWDGILCFKIGKFYELYYCDADIGHKMCDLKYMGGGVPHTGFPEKSFNKYAEIFVRHGYKVYRVEQTMTKEEQKRQKKKIVTRAVCEVLTKGTIISEEFLENCSANYILAIVEERSNNASASRVNVGVCFMDFSTGIINIGQFTDDRNRARLRTLLYQINASEIVFVKNSLSRETVSLLRGESGNAQLRGQIENEQFYDCDKTVSVLSEEKYWSASEGSEGMPEVLKSVMKNRMCMHALGGILYKLQSTMHDLEILPHSQWHRYDPTGGNNIQCTDYLTLDGSTLANLEILRNESGGHRGTLVEFVDHCVTKFGKRKLEVWLRAPLNKMHLINERLDAVEYLIDDSSFWHETLEIKAKLSALPDLERLLHNLAILGTKNRAIDKAVMFENCWTEAKIRKLEDSVKGFEQIHRILTDISAHKNEINSQLIIDICTMVPTSVESGEERKINERNMVDFAQLLSDFKESYEIDVLDDTKRENEKRVAIQPVSGMNKEFDSVMCDLEENSKKLEKCLIAIQNRHKSREIRWFHKKTNGSKVKDTFQIEIPKKLNIVQEDDWLHRTETRNVNRWHTPRINALLQIREKCLLQKEFVLKDCARATFARFAESGNIWKKIVSNIAILDCLLSLAHASAYAVDCDMNRPVFVARNANESAFLEIREGKHPCIGEAHLSLSNNKSGNFIPNDTVLGTKENKANFVIVTGPNMGGKSTLLRQTCVAVILAHIGCFVPCASMRLTPIDRIFTRVGAFDRILAGQSTFMVELEETSNILSHATSDSLVILDELGRGTSTFDGTAIAYAVAKELIHKTECRCLFSTHYHGLCDSFVANDRVAMYHMSFTEDTANERITFLYKFTRGICKNSHGINCAKMAFDNVKFKDMLERAKLKAKVLHEQMHTNDEGSNGNGNANANERELIAEFQGLMRGLIEKDLWNAIQRDIQRNANMSG